MNSSNRFSSLLKNLMNTANLKNTVLAQELQYDVSYISKWSNGQILPAEKGIEKILTGISGCIVRSVEDTVREQLYNKYNVDNTSDLEGAIFDNLLIEYNYVKELKDDTGSEVAPPFMYYPELTLLQFVTKMKHPVLRNVQSLNVVVMMDLLSMEKNSQYVVAELHNYSRPEQHIVYTGVHFDMLLDMSVAMDNPIHNTTLLLNMIANFARLDFNMYETKQARGKAIFTVDGGFNISGMIIDNNHCIAVTTSEEQEISSVMYHKLRSFCSKNNSLFLHEEMSEFIMSGNYMKAILSEHHYWMSSYLSEHFMPESLFTEILETMKEEEEPVYLEQLQRNYRLCKNILNATETNVMIIDAAIHSLMVYGNVSFYHKKLQLNIRQRLDYLKHILELIEQNDKLKIRLLGKDTFSDFLFIGSPNIFISDAASHLRLSESLVKNRVEVINSASMDQLLKTAYNSMWEILGETAEKRAAETIQQTIRTMDILYRTEKEQLS